MDENDQKITRKLVPVVSNFRRSLSIVGARSASREEWQAVWQACPYATYYHSPEWSYLWQDYTSGQMQSTPVLFDFSDGTSVIFPLSHHKVVGGMVSKYMSSVPQDVTYGGWISRRKLTIEHAYLIIGFLRQNYKNLLWRLNPYNDLVHRINISPLEEGTTHVLRLSEDIEKLFGRFSKGHRNAVKRARANGITVRRGNSLEDWKAYYSLYLDSVRRWGKNAFCVHSWNLFELMYNMNSPYINLWLAEHQDTVIAARIIVYSQNHVISWHGVALEKEFHLRPVNLLHYEMIKDSYELGYQWYDFGPSGNLQGVRKFKEHFGTQTLPCGKVRHMSSIFSFGRKWAQMLNSIG
jgi:hypothetical protein